MKEIRECRVKKKLWVSGEEYLVVETVVTMFDEDDRVKLTIEKVDEDEIIGG